MKNAPSVNISKTLFDKIFCSDGNHMAILLMASTATAKQSIDHTNIMVIFSPCMSKRVAEGLAH